LEPALELGEAPKPAMVAGAEQTALQQKPAAGELLEVPEDTGAAGGPTSRRPRELLPAQTHERSVNWALILGVGGLVFVVLLVVGLTMAALFLPRLTEKSEGPPPTKEEMSTTQPHPAARPARGAGMAIPLGGPGVGQAAPEITGEDLDGQPLKLSDYRGKVVVLVFWADSSKPCREAYPFQRRMVQRLEGRPFVLLGINRDGDREHAKQVVRDEHLTWRSWWDGGPRGGPIGRRWFLKDGGLPTTYVLDSKGVIRVKKEGVPQDALLDQTIDALLAEVPRGDR
jgi:peroxiredoxin